jgi:peptidyl-prolyl cis-trans isomerase C
MRSLLAAGLAAGLALAGQTHAQDQAAAPEAPVAPPTADTVVARVNGTDITLGHVIVMRERLPAQYQNLPDVMLLELIVEQLVDQTLLADTLSTDPANDPAEVKLHLDNERRGNLALLAATAQAEAALTEEAVKAAYDAAVGGFTPQPEYNAAHILVDSEEKAKELLTRIEGGADFAELARENSSDPGSGPNGGDLGWFGKGMMVPEFEEAVVAMEPGSVSAPVQTQFGWHLIRLNETRDSVPPTLDQLRSQIEDGLRQEALQAELTRLREGAEIEVIEGAVVPEAIRDGSLLRN